MPAKKKAVGLPPRSKMAAIIAEQFAQEAIGDNGRFVPIVISVTCGEKICQAQVGPEVMKRLLPDPVQQLLLEHLIDRLTVAGLAGVLGVSKSHVSHLKRQEKKFQPHHLERLEESLELSDDLRQLLKWLVEENLRSRAR